MKRRLEPGGALTQPELSVLMAYTKIVLAEELLASDLPEDPYLAARPDLLLPAGRPRRLLRRQIEEHPLRREIIVTQVVNDLVNGAGMTYWPRLAGETGASAAELTRANFVAREIFGSLPLREELATYDNVLDAAVQTRMRVEMRTLVERASRWLVTNRRPPLDSQATVDLFAEPVQATMLALPELLVGRELAAYDARRSALVEQDVPEDLAARVASYDVAYALLNVVEIAERDGLKPQRRGAGALRARGAARRLGASAADRRAAAGRPVADDGARGDARRPARGARPADRRGPGHQSRRGRREGGPRGAAGRGGARVAEWEAATGEVAARAVETLARSVPTRTPIWPGCRSRCGWCAGCWPDVSRKPRRLGRACGQP